MTFSSSILKTFQNGDFIIVHDEHREKEGDFFVLAENITAKKINFLQKKATGLNCTASDPEILDR